MKVVDHGWLEGLPLAKLHYAITPLLVGSLTYAHRLGGAISARRFSYYALKRLHAAATRARIAEFVLAADQRAQPEEIEHVLAGDLLPRRRSIVQDLIQRAAMLVEAVDEYAGRSKRSTPEVFAIYCELARSVGNSGVANWRKYASQDRARLLELCRKRAKPHPGVEQLYSWMDADALLGSDSLLRAAVLFWALTEQDQGAVPRMAIFAVVAHELRVGLDHRGLLVLEEHKQGREALAMGRGLNVAMKAMYAADVTPVLEHFAHHVGMALSRLEDRLRSKQDDDDRLPWLMVRPPDELDRQVFEAIERHGSATSSVVLKELPDPRPPLRTLQRRLQKLARDGLLVKHGGRKDAFYRVAGRV